LSVSFLISLTFNYPKAVKQKQNETLSLIPCPLWP
jgi:hypothetical protein